MWLRPPAAVALLWIFFLLRGAFYCLSMPVWEGYDEPYQFAAAQYAAHTGTMAAPATPICRQVAASIYLLPAPWMLRLHDLPAPVLTREAYWALPEARRQQMHEELLALPPAWASQPSNPVIGNYEGQQAPLYFFLTAPALRVISNASLPSQVLLLRLIGLLAASLAIPIGYAFALDVLRSQRRALLATALAVSLPELMVNLCRVSNETAALLLATAFLLLAVRFVQSENPQRWLPLLALTLAIALLTKAYFLTFVPALVILALLRLSTGEHLRRNLASGIASLAILGAIAGPWYWRIHRTTGSWSGQGDDAALGRLSRVALLEQAVHVNWKSGLGSILLSHIWFGGWSFLRLSAWAYAVVLLFAVLAAIGVVRYLWRLASRTGTTWRRDPVVAITVIYLCFWAGLCYHVLVTYVHSGVSASTGWYLYCLVFAETVLIAVGFAWIGQNPEPGKGSLGEIPPQASIRDIEKTQPSKGSLSRSPSSPLDASPTYTPRSFFPRYGAAGAVALFAAIDLYGMHALMLPYYGGLSAHVGDRVPPLSPGKLLRLPIAFVFDRLSSIGPQWLTPSLMGISWTLYIIATFGVAGLAIGLSRLDDHAVCGQFQSRSVTKVV